MDKNLCLLNIESKLKNLTDAERKVAKYILDHAVDVLGFTVTELADGAAVSEATVVRFCRNIGFKGYQDLKINLAKDVLVPHKHLNTALEQSDTPAQIANKIIRSEINALEMTLSLLDLTEMERVANVIRQAKRVVFFGTGGSALVAEDAVHKFLKIGISCFMRLDSDFQSMQSAVLTPGDVAFGVSHSGSNKQTIECMKNAKACGATLVGLTTSGKSPLQQLCDYVLMTASNETVFRSESVSARIAHLAVIDSLAAIISYLDYNSSFDAIQKTRRATSNRKY